MRILTGSDDIPAAVLIHYAAQLDAMRLFNFNKPSVARQPVCYTPCHKNLFCVQDNVCGCHEGYKVSINGDGELYCRPQCATACMENSKCVGPNVCECNAGYHLVDLDCVPYCSSGCMNGHCVAPEVCHCNDGYKLVGNTCEVILEDYVKPMIYPIYTTTSTTLKPMSTTLLSGLRTTKNTTDILFLNRNGEFVEENNSSTDLFTADTLETTTESMTTLTTDYVTTFTIDIDVDIEDDDSIEDFRSYCPNDYFYHKGRCHSLSQENPGFFCNPHKCGPNLICLENGKCGCPAGYRYVNTEGTPTNCVGQIKKKERLRIAPFVPKEQKFSLMSHMFTIIGSLCVTIAILCLLSKLYGFFK